MESGSNREVSPKPDRAIRAELNNVGYEGGAVLYFEDGTKLFVDPEVRRRFEENNNLPNDQRLDYLLTVKEN
jgi:hypothetical protein